MKSSVSASLPSCAAVLPTIVFMVSLICLVASIDSFEFAARVSDDPKMKFMLPNTELSIARKPIGSLLNVATATPFACSSFM